MKKILLFGNSGSGKSTLAKKLCLEHDLEYLDLDNLAWKLVSPPERRSIDESEKQINWFINEHHRWVIEGCYTDLLELAEPYSNEIIFLNLPSAVCISNAKKRPWEPHKYASKEAQDQNLQMLIDWISQYAEREDTFSDAAHRTFYENYSGKKTMFTSNDRDE